MHDFFQSSSNDKLERTAGIWEATWKNRINAWQGKETRSLEKLVELAIESLWSFQQAKRKDEINPPSPRANPQYKWMRPPLGMVKINTDATIFEKENVIGLGAVIRDD